MPSDIRNFFGGGGPPRNANSTPKKGSTETKPVKKSRGRKVVSDDEEEEEAPQTKTKKSTPVKPKKPAKEAQVEETSSSAYFESKKEKPSKATSGRSQEPTGTNGVTKTPTKKSNGSAPTSARRSARKSGVRSYAEDDNDSARILGDKDGGDDDIFAEDYGKTRRKDDDYEEGTDNDELPSRPRTKKMSGKPKKIDSEDEDMETAQIPVHDGPGDSRKKPSRPTTASGRKRKSKDVDEDDDDLLDGDTTPKAKARKSSAKSTPNKKPRATTKKDEKDESKEIKDIMDNIPLVRAPTPPPRDGTSKFTFGGGNANVAPMAAGSKEIPTGADNCLAGMTFVFTGVLQSLGREEGQNLVKQYGGKITTGPSSKTSFVVLGSDAGPKKLETIKKLGIKTIDEDGLFQLIKVMPANGGDGKAAEKHAEKQAKEEERIRKEAEDMDRKEKERQKEAAKAIKAATAKGGAPSAAAKSARPKIDDRLWVDRYAPDSIAAVCGNKAQVEGLQRWLRNWHNNAKFQFKKAGADGKGVFRAAMIHGPPGIGKTTAAHLIAKLEGFDIVESNASDTRSKKLVEAGLTGVLDTTSLLGYFSGDGKKVEAAKRKLVLIMDEVDGMSAGDRGGVGALAAVAKKTKIPMILICNERKLPKMKPFDFVTADFGFRRPTTDMIRGRIATIAFREGLRFPPQVLNAIIEGANADIRQIINMISTIKMDNKEIDFDDSKAMSKAWEKHVILKPWDIVSKILRPQMFSPSSTATLNDKIELYFNDHEFSYLMLQENYLKTQPTVANSYNGRQRNLKLLELASNAADSISDGDLVDRMIHGSQQQWSLMPTHAIFSFVRPASQMYGNFNTQVGFASWLGMNSKQGKLSRFVKEIQGHMRLRSSGDRHEVRQQYLPAIWNRTVKVLRDEGKDAVQDVIDFMDSYYLTKDDFDAMVELGVGPMDQENLKLETATKATFTRLYNSQSHPMPFIKASAVSGAAARIGAAVKRDKPDLEEAIEDDEVEGADDGALDPDAKDEVDDGNEEIDLKKDKYIKAPKKKAAAKGGANSKADKGGSKGKGKGKRTKDDDDDDDESEEEPKPKKSRSATNKGKAKAKT